MIDNYYEIIRVRSVGSDPLFFFVKIVKFLLCKSDFFSKIVNGGFLRETLF